MSLNKCACIDTLYTELPWAERFEAAKDDGFAAVEFWDWRIRDLDETKKAAEDAGIQISGFNGDADYSLVDPEHKQKYLEDLKKSIEAAQKSEHSVSRFILMPWETAVLWLTIMIICLIQ